MARLIAGIVAGLVLAYLLSGGLGMAGASLFPVSVDPTIKDPVKQMAAAFPGAPLSYKLVMAFSWLVGGFFAAFIALRLSRRAAGGWIAAALFALIAVAGRIVLPMPGWMVAAALLLPLLGGFIATRVPVRRDEPAAHVS